MPAFEAAWERGASWVEFDVRLSGDSEPMVIHDPHTDDGRPLTQQSAVELVAKGIPTLDATLGGLPEGMGADVEIKHREGEPDWTPETRIAHACASILARHSGTRPLLATSFDPQVLRVLAALAPTLPTGLVTGVLQAVTTGAARAAGLGCVALAPHYSAPGLSHDGLGAIAGSNLAIMVWTVNGSWHARRLAGMGVQAICTDDVDGTVEALGRLPRSSGGTSAQ